METKGSPEWMRDYTAVGTILRDDNLAKPLGRVIREYPAMTRFLTWSSMLVELWAPWAILLGGKLFRGVFRLLGCVSLMGLHAGMGNSIALGWFQVTNATKSHHTCPFVFLLCLVAVLSCLC